MLIGSIADMKTSDLIGGVMWAELNRLTELNRLAELNMLAVCVLKNTIFPRKNSPRLAQLAPPFVTDAARGVLRVAPSALLAHNGEVARRR